MRRNSEAGGGGAGCGGKRGPEAGALWSARLAAAVTRWRVAVLVAAAVAAVGAGWFGYPVHERLSASGQVPAAAEAVRAEKALDEEFGGAGANVVLVARVAEGSVDDPRAVAAGNRLARSAARDPSVRRVVSYWPDRRRELRSADGRSALVLVRLRGEEARAARTAGRLLPELTGGHGVLTVSANGDAAVQAEVMRQAGRDQHRAELLALPATTLVLLVVYRSAVAAVLPVLVGGLAALGTMVVLRLFTAWTEVSVYAWNIGVALGFALAVDYSLFLLTRYREELVDGTRRQEALRVALSTAGRAVVFSAVTVAAALATLLLFPHALLRSVAYGGITVVVLAALVNLVVLPACLAVLGDRLERADVFARWRRRPGSPGGARPPGRWGRCARAVMRRPLPVALAVTTGLLLVAAPFAGVRFGMFDDRVLPASSAVGNSTNVLREDFTAAGAVVGATTVVMPRFDVRARPAALEDYARRLADRPGVVRVDTATGSYRAGHPTGAAESAARFVSHQGVWLSVATRYEPYGPENRDLVRALRAVPAPAPALVGGPGARLADAQQALSERLPAVLLLVTGVLLLLVVLLTRRVVLAVKALLLNGLSLCATFGAMVHIFQEGHLAWLLGDFAVAGYTDVLMPVLVFCCAFGMSMDYEIFLLTRVCEEYERTGETEAAVCAGLDRTARLFTWAAATFAVVMAALASSELVVLKVFGVGLALAALLDATLVRGLLVPAVMALAGRANWWVPRPFAVRGGGPRGAEDGAGVRAAGSPGAPADPLGEPGAP
ncbi:MMPL family transporter [Streptomyces sp. TRM76323]|uniref:MMPL family transporter n=1 Tax=Streptomyces tamarix TaxID=3078565 RepID=A0ABU3QEM0_9ACTN|nr:MMPL family transporter [Streptomyces tamarix]MDT9681212.1 MMPL family transporter [Streptomyces tamarix]